MDSSFHPNLGLTTYSSACSVTSLFCNRTSLRDELVLAQSAPLSPLDSVLKLPTGARVQRLALGTGVQPQSVRQAMCGANAVHRYLPSSFASAVPPSHLCHSRNLPAAMLILQCRDSVSFRSAGVYSRLRCSSTSPAERDREAYSCNSPLRAC